MTALLDGALGYAARGIPVYPVHWPRPTPSSASLACSCSRGPACDRPAKHPLVRHGVKEATTDPDRIGRWWQRWPQANLGLATGIVFDVLDIDGAEGLTALRKLPRAADLRLPGPLVATGGGGWHHWFTPTGSATAHPTASPMSTGAAAGAACWPHPAATSGGSYRWLVDLDRAPLAEVPAALWARLDPDRPPGAGQPARPGRPHPATRMAGSWPPSWPPSAGPPPATATAPSTAPRSRSTATSPAASSTTRTSPSPFTTAALAIGLDRAETARTLASARTAGLAHPRTIPPPPDPSRQEVGA